MKKSYLIMAAIASLAFVSCSDEEFVGNPELGPGQGKTAEIVFGSVGKGMTRADFTGEAAANELNKNFVFEGTKAVDNTTYSLVINDYQANYKTNTAHSTESNSDNWEYVGYKNVPGGVTTNVGVPTFAESQTGNNVITQTIKYWDYATTQYDFAAYSLGKGKTTTENNTSSTTYATASTIDMTKAGTANTVYSLTGSADELKACYISDLVTHYNKQASGNDPAANDFGKVVTFNFRSLATKIRMAFYETVPGYSVKDIKFYSITKESEGQNPEAPTSIPTLFTATSVLPSGNGTMNITFPTVGWANREAKDYNKAHVAFNATSANDLSKTLALEGLANWADAESKETSTDNPVTGWIGRSSNAATYAGGLDNGTGKYYTILPYETGANLLLRIKYTLVSIDGSGEVITVDNATAVIPAELAQWQPNYAYTYIFKISDMTNGSTGVDGSGNVVTGLTPITLNAVVVDSEDGIQETITTVSDPSITTYTQGKVVTENDEYLSGNKIYVIVNNGTENVVLTNKAKLYTVTQTKANETTSAANPSQPISEESVANAFANDKDNVATTWSVTDANGWTLTLTESNLMSVDSKIDAADSPTGNEITIGDNKVGKFTAGAAGTIYAFQYEKAESRAYTQEEVNAYNAGLPNAITANDKAYSFTSFGSNTGSPQYGTGIVKVVSTGNGWTTVKVLSNNNDPNDSFVNQEFKVNATELTAGTYYQLYTTAGVAQPIYVTVTESTATQINSYNATLTGAVSTSNNKPAEYAYKIIKIKE